jgi:NADPH:quinone reductase-like Zn-dependent oxidoreductase
MLVSLAALQGGEVVATAGPSSRARVEAAGARHVLDYRDEQWVAQVLEITGGSGVPAAVNAARGGAAEVIGAVADGGRLATITSDPPSEERAIAVTSQYVRPDGRQLRRLAELLDQHAFEPQVGATYSLDEAAGALAAAVSGRAGGAVVLSVA